MVKKTNIFSSIVLRYLVLLLVALPNLWIFYTIFTPLTTYPVYWLLNIFFNTTLTYQNLEILFNFKIFPIEIIGPCVAASAYYLLLILNLSTPGIKIKQRANMIIVAFLTFLVINILRIFLLSLLLIKSTRFFDLTHMVFWYLLSTVFVVGIWFWQVRKFKIKGVPFYSDLRLVYRAVRKM